MAAVVIAIRARNRRRRQKQQQHDELVVFEKYDTEHTGKLNPAQLRRALIDLGIEASSVEAEAVLDKYARRGHSEGDEFVDRMHIPGGGLDVRSFRALVSDITERSSHLSEERTIEKLARQASLDKLAIRGRLPYEHQVRAFYMGKSCTIFFAALIAANFLINCIEKEVDPGTGASRQQQSPGLWVALDNFFNSVFLIELIINIWGSGGPFQRFWASGWNRFDFFIVAVGVIFMTGAIPPDNPLSNLKMLRAFRVFRLFKRIESLNKIIVALLSSLPGVFNAFVIMVIFMMIFAILAVEYFAPLGQEFGEAGLGVFVTYGDGGTNHTISADTARGFVHGMEYFGTFLRALFSLFQVMTGESWSEAIARPLMFGLYSNAALVSVFFVLFLLLFQVVLINVVIAVLLDKFVADEKTDEEDEAHRKMSLSARDLGIGGLDLGQEGGLAGESGGESVLAVVPTSASPPSSSHAQARQGHQGENQPSQPPNYGGREAKSKERAVAEDKVSRIIEELAALREDLDQLKLRTKLAR